MDREDYVPNNETSLTKMLKMALLYRAMKKIACVQTSPISFVARGKGTAVTC